MVGALKTEAWWKVFRLFGYWVVLLRTSVGLAFTPSCHEVKGLAPLNSPLKSEVLPLT